jgi:hypothetical protein
VQTSDKEVQKAHRDSVNEKMQPVITLVKVMQITDDRAFVTSYQQLLEQRFQTIAQMQQVLAVVDVSKDAVAARLNLFKYRGSSSTISKVCPISLLHRL